MAPEQEHQATHYTTAVVRGTPGFVDPLIANGLQHSPLTDGYAMAITILMALVAQPAVGLKGKCRHMFKHPRKPQRWQPPGVPDATAGEWPEEVASRLMQIVTGLTKEWMEDRLPLADALREMESIVHEAGDDPTPAQGLCAPSTTEETEDRRFCVVCLSQPREVHFSMLRLTVRARVNDYLHAVRKESLRSVLVDARMHTVLQQW